MPGSDAHLLLVDISNSFTKMALATPERLIARRRVATSDLTRVRLKSLLRGWRFGRVILSSVVPARSTAVRALRALRGVLEVSHRVCLGIGIDYPQPGTIGADRLANAAAVAALYTTPAVVVDFGTAVTFDVVDRRRGYVGGVIAPGLEVMTEYLHRRTALLPRVKIEEPRSAIGRSTRAAMQAGAVIGYRGLVAHLLEAVRREIAPRGHVCTVATGGYAALIARGMDVFDAVAPDLTLHGLRVIDALNPV